MHFVHHLDDTLSGNHDYMLLSNTILLRHTMVAYSNEVNDTRNFKSFSDEYHGIQVHHASDVSRITWSGIESMKQNSCHVSFKSVERDGSCFDKSKRNVLSLPLDYWNHLKFRLTENEASIVAYGHSFKTHAHRMKF